MEYVIGFTLKFWNCQGTMKHQMFIRNWQLMIQQIEFNCYEISAIFLIKHNNQYKIKCSRLSCTKGCHSCEKSENFKHLTKPKALVFAFVHRKFISAAENNTENDKYEGFAKDLIDEIAKKCGFRYEIIIGGEYGKENPVTKEWNGIIGEIVNKVSETECFRNILLQYLYFI